jgi:hypothetical protein
VKRTLFGVLVLALVATGAYWARRTGPPPPPSTGSASTTEAIPSDASPDVTLADATVALDDARITLSVSPRPPAAFAKNRFRVRAESASGAPIVLDDARVSFEMTMPMGEHRYALVPGQDGWREAEVVLPMCQSGNPRWYAVVEGTVGGKPVMARFRLDLATP